MFISCNVHLPRTSCLQCFSWLQHEAASCMLQACRVLYNDIVTSCFDDCMHATAGDLHFKSCLSTSLLMLNMLELGFTSCCIRYGLQVATRSTMHRVPPAVLLPLALQWLMLVPLQLPAAVMVPLPLLWALPGLRTPGRSWKLCW
jgi:hypothetical protein